MEDYKDCCVTVSYGKVANSYQWFPVFGLAIYRKSIRKRDGALIWRYHGHYGGTRRSFNLIQKDARETAERLGVPYIEGVRHNNLIDGQNMAVVGTEQ